MSMMKNVVGTVVDSQWHYSFCLQRSDISSFTILCARLLTVDIFQKAYNLFDIFKYMYILMLQCGWFFVANELILRTSWITLRPKHYKQQ